MNWPGRRAERAEADAAAVVVADETRERARRTGEVLRQARTERKITLSDVEQDIRINRTYLEALEGARLRFRPILMTSMAFILGVMPLAFSSGAGAGARQSVGTGVMGGMMAATFLAIFFVPMFFKLITDWHFTEKRSTAQLRAETGSSSSSSSLVVST